MRRGSYLFENDENDDEVRYDGVDHHQPNSSAHVKNSQEHQQWTIPTEKISFNRNRFQRKSAPERQSNSNETITTTIDIMAPKILVRSDDVNMGPTSSSPLVTTAGLRLRD